LKGLNPCQNPKNPSKCRAERLAVSNCAVVQQPVRTVGGISGEPMKQRTAGELPSRRHGLPNCLGMRYKN